MKENRKLHVSKGVFFGINYLAIAGIVLGILLFLGYMAKTSYYGDRAPKEFVDSYAYESVYQDKWYQTAQFISLQEMLEVNGEFTTDQEMGISVYLETRDETITVAYDLEDIISWNTRGFTWWDEDSQIDYSLLPDSAMNADISVEVPVEETVAIEAADADISASMPEAVTVHALEELYFPSNYGSLEEITEEYSMNAEEANVLYDRVGDQIAYIGDCVQNYHYLKGLLAADATNFRYFALRGDNKAFTNMDVSTVKEAESAAQELGSYYIWNEATAEIRNTFSDDGSMSIHSETLQRNWISYTESSVPYGEDLGSWKVVTGVDMNYPVSDAFTERMAEFEQYQPLYGAGIGLTVLSVIVYLISFIALTVMTGKGTEDGELNGIRLTGIDHWKTELAILFFCALAAGLLFMDYFAIHIIAAYFDRNLSMLWFCAGVAMLAAMVSNVGLLSGWLSLARRIKAGTLWKNSLVCGLIQTIGECWDARTVTLKTVVCYVGFLLMNLLFLMLGDGIGLILAVIADVIVALLLLRQAVQMQQIREGIARITDGELEYKIEEKRLSGDNLALARAVNNIGDGLANAVEKSMKSERLKTDLITNVSHDIKTPLTSIINYVDLLKRENIQDEKIQGYLEILEAKSQRLKTLTEDLVEASKVSSGNVKLEFMNMDFVELVNQTNGEFSEKFAAKELKLITRLPDEPVYVRADGRRLWRVVENLYNNAAKYAMPGSRVYADLTADDLTVTFMLKNMSEQPLNFGADELTERFVRGDVSRTTEGSGLGLSIAKNLTELQNGTFEIYLDGDLFRVTVKFPRVK